MGPSYRLSATRSRRREKSTAGVLLLAVLILGRSIAAADERTAAQWMSATSQFFLEINDPATLRRIIRDGISLPTPERLWPDAHLKPFAVAFDAKHRGVLFAIDSTAGASNRIVCETTYGLLRLCAEGLGLGGFVFQHEVGSTTMRHIGPLGWFENRRFTIVSTRRSLTFDAWRTIHDPQHQSLAETNDFRAAMSALPSDRVATFFVHRGERQSNCLLLARIAQAAAGVGRSTLPKPLRELAIQTALQPLEEVRFMAVAVSDREPKPHLTVVLPSEVPRMSRALRVLAAIPQQGHASKPLVPSSTMLSISAFVNRQAIELASETLFNAKGIAAIQETNPEIAALLQGLFFTVDASRQIEPQVQIVIARRPIAETEEDAPRFRLPGVAVIFVPKNSKQLKPVFSLAFMGAMNEVNKRAQHENRPRYKLVGQRIGDVTVTSGVLRERKQGQRPAAPLLASISPSIAFLDRRFIFSTDAQLAVDLVKLAEKQPDATTDTSLRLNIGPVEIMRSLIDNYEAALRQSVPMRHVHQLAGPLMDSTVLLTRQLLQLAPSPKLSIDQPPIVLPFTLDVTTP